MTSISILPTSTALVLIDLQTGILSIPTEPIPVNTVISNARKLVDACRASDILVIYVRVAFSPDKRNALKPDADEPAPSFTNLPSNWSDIVKELDVKENDLLITKRQWGAFYGTELDLELRRRGVSTLILGGVSTNFGVESTARDAYERGFNLIFASDAMSSRAASDHEFPLKRIFPRIGKVRTTSEILSTIPK
jgi:nicotinamidase-related amidase